MARGHIYKRSDVSWTIVYPLPPDPATGKRRQKSEAIRGTKRQAEKALNQRLNEIEQGTYVEEANTTVEEFLQRWLEDYAQQNLKERTAREYAAHLKNHVIPEIGQMQLRQVKPNHIQQLYTKKLRTGRADGQAGGLSKRSVQYIHTILRRALGHAVQWQVLKHNPTDGVEPPTPRNNKMQYWNHEQVQQFLREAEETRLYALYHLAINTGMRRGELLGLAWEDVDLHNKQISVRQSLSRDADYGVSLQEPKTPSSIRTISITSEDVAVLESHRRKQAAEKLKVGPDYDDHGLVFASSVGTPTLPRNLIRQFKRLSEQAGVPEIRFHDLRHTSATLMLQAGVHPKVVQERLGHSNISTTLDTYSHALPNMQQEAARALQDLLSDDLQEDISTTEG